MPVVMRPCSAECTDLWTWGPPGSCLICSQMMYNTPAFNLQTEPGYQLSSTRHSSTNKHLMFTWCLRENNYSKLFKPSGFIELLCTNLFILLEDMDSSACIVSSFSRICRNTTKYSIVGLHRRSTLKTFAVFSSTYQSFYWLQQGPGLVVPGLFRILIEFHLNSYFKQVICQRQ